MPFTLKPYHTESLENRWMIVNNGRGITPAGRCLHVAWQVRGAVRGIPTTNWIVVKPSTEPLIVQLTSRLPALAVTPAERISGSMENNMHVLTSVAPGDRLRLEKCGSTCQGPNKGSFHC
jgi:hypothetical protein